MRILAEVVYLMWRTLAHCKQVGESMCGATLSNYVLANGGYEAVVYRECNSIMDIHIRNKWESFTIICCIISSKSVVPNKTFFFYLLQVSVVIT